MTHYGRCGDWECTWHTSGSREEVWERATTHADETGHVAVVEHYPRGTLYEGTRWRIYPREVKK